MTRTIQNLQKMSDKIFVCPRCGRPNFIKYILNDCKCLCDYQLLPEVRALLREAFEKFMFAFQDAREYETLSMIR